MTASHIVLGAGPCGLGAAWRFCQDAARPTVAVELQDRVGGLAGTFTRGPFRLDFGPHKFYTRYPHIQALVEGLLGSDLRPVAKTSAIWLKGRRLNFPLGLKDMLFGLGPVTAGRIGASFAAAAALGGRGGSPERTYEDWVVRRFGREAFELVFRPMAEKVWGDPATLDADLARVRIAAPSLWEVVSRALLGDRGKAEINAKTFYYPRLGFQQIWDAFAARIRGQGGELLLGTRPARVVHDGRRVSSVRVASAAGERELAAQDLVSSIPLADFLGLFDPPPPAEVLEAASRLSYRASVLAYLVVRRPRLLGRDAWIFFPERRYVFCRVAEQKAMSPEMIPPDVTVVTADIATAPGGDVWRMTDAALRERVVSDLAADGLLAPGEVEDFFTVRLPRVYPVYDVELKGKLDVVWRWLDRIENVVSAGRHGYFQHNNSDNALDMGIVAAEHLLERRGLEAWAREKRRFAEFQIVD